jgi:phosphatidate phosphatase APP1
MAYNYVDIEHRVTRKYRDGWSYLDRQEYIGKAIVLDQSRWTTWDDSGTIIHTVNTIMLVTNEEQVPPKYICEAIRDTFGGSSCQHDYDCCGCFSTHVSGIEVMDGDIYKFSTTATQNY